MNRWRLTALLAGLAAAAVLVLAGWWYFAGERPPAPPEVSREGMDPEVASAIDKAEAAVRAAPRDGKAWGRLGTVLFAHGAQAEARLCFAHAERFDPAQGRWPYLLAELLIRQDREAAIRSLERAAERNSSRDLAQLRLAELLLEEGRLDEAERLFRLVLTRQPQDGRALFGLGKIQYQRGELRPSLESLQAAARIAANAKAVRALLAEVHHRLGESKEAAAQLEKLRGLPDRHEWPDPLLDEVGEAQVGVEARMSRIDALFHARRNQEAVQLLQDTLALYPDSYLPHRTMGHYLTRVGRPREALDALRRAAQLRPDSNNVQHDLGVLLYRLEEYAEAAEAFRAAAKRKPDDPILQLRLAQCLEKLGDVKGAAAAARAAVERDPANEAAKKLLEQLEKR